MAKIASEPLSPSGLPRNLRIPKLSYRNSSYGCADHRDSFSTISTAYTQGNASTVPASPGCSSFLSSASLTPDSKLSDQEISHGSPPPINTPSTTSRTPSPKPLTESSAEAKKKGTSLLSFFSVKEPSAQAFEDYQKQMRKKAQTSNNRALIAGLPGVSSAKLPETVPKVNSRWDGIPESQRECKAKHNSIRHSLIGRNGDDRGLQSQDSSSCMSTASSQGTWSGYGSAGSRSSSTNKLSEIYGWESISSVNIDEGSEPRIRTVRPKDHTHVSESALDSSSKDTPDRSTALTPRTLQGGKDLDGVIESTVRTQRQSTEWKGTNHLESKEKRLNSIAIMQLPTPQPSNQTVAPPFEGLPPVPSLVVDDCSAADAALTEQSEDTTENSWDAVKKGRVLEEQCTPSAVVVRSAGEDILPPPIINRTSAHPGTTAPTFLEGSLDPGVGHTPLPASKRSIAPRRFRYPHRPKISSIFSMSGPEANTPSESQNHDANVSQRLHGPSLSQHDHDGEDRGVMLDDPSNASAALHANIKAGLRTSLRQKARLPLFRFKEHHI